MAHVADNGVYTDYLFSLSAEDVERTRDTVLAHFKKESESGSTSSLIFARIDVVDPLKAEVATVAAVRAFRRRTVATVIDRQHRKVYDVLVDLAEGRVISSTFMPGVQPNIPLEDMEAFETVCKSSEEVRSVLRSRGVRNFRPELLQVDPISSGNFGIEAEKGRRLATGFAYYLDHPLDNGYAHPVPGLSITVDLDTREVFRINDFPTQGSEIPKTDHASYNGTLHQWYSPLLASQPRMERAKPLEIVQPDGPSFAFSGVSGRHITWLEWDMDIGFNYREGLTLHRITYRDPTTARQRPICYRASVAEMAVPYAAPGLDKHRQNPIDSGEYGLGALANSLTNGCDCLGEIRYLDVVVNDGAGNPRTIPSAICIHEEDAGLLWKHYDFRYDLSEVRRKRILVISFVATVGNYDYAFYWKFSRDGAFELDVKLTGIIHTEAKHPVNEKYGTEVQPGVMGTVHSHFFCARLDMTVDGLRNRVSELDYVAEDVPGPNNCNEQGNAVFVAQNKLLTERTAARKSNPRAERTWIVGSSDRRNAMGKPTCYKLVPRSHVLPLQSPGYSKTRRRLAFLSNHIWVTPFDPTQRFPAGDFPNQASGPIGLPVWTQADRKVWDEDIVVWHNFGVHHKPRIEDWPCMTCVTTGFSMEPYGFFDKNPALLLPSPAPKQNIQVGAPPATSASNGDSCCHKARL